MKYLQLSTILLLLFGSCLFGFACRSTPSFNVNVISPIDGSVYRTNLIKMQILVSDPNAILKINGEIKEIIGNNEYNNFVQLREGENKFIISASLDKTVSEKSITVLFVPNTSVFLDYPVLSQSISSPFVVSGKVFPSQATLSVNNTEVEVNLQGLFVTQVTLKEGNNIIKAIASYSETVDTSQYTILVENGKPFSPPGQGLAYMSRWVLDRSVSVIKGHSSIVETTFRSGKKSSTYAIPQDTSFAFIPVANESSFNRISLPAGLSINLTPSTLTTYPNTDYPIELNIQTTSDIQPGEYWIMLQIDTESQRWMKIKVLPSS